MLGERETKKEGQGQPDKRATISQQQTFYDRLNLGSSRINNPLIFSAQQVRLS